LFSPAERCSLLVGHPDPPCSNLLNNERTLTHGPTRTGCDLCGDDDPEVLYRGRDRRHNVPGEFTLVRCRRCTLIYLNPRPDATTLAAHYPAEYTPFSAPSGLVGKVVARLRRREAATIRAATGPAARVLEVGCAAGDLLVPLREQGLHVAGIEPSSHASALARDRHGLDVMTGTLSDATLDDASFDAVVMRNVVEHLPSPRQDLSVVARILKDGGRLFLATDNVASVDCRVFGSRWYGFDVPRHLNLFSPRTLTRLLESTGFLVERTAFSLVPNHWIVSARYLLEERFGGRRLCAAAASFLSLRNPLLLASLVPVTFAQRLFRNGGRMSMVAIKRSARVQSSVFAGVFGVGQSLLATV
jgi:SAM-dependent methyltransferase